MKIEVGMAIKVRKQGMSFRLPCIFPFWQDACQCLILHPYITASRTIINIVLEKWFPLQGERTHSFLEKKNFFENQIHSFFALLSSSVSRANLSYVVATIFSSLAFLSSSISMANLNHLVAASFSSFALLSSFVSTANLSCMLATTFSSLSFSPTYFHHLASIFWEWPGTVSRGLLFVMTFSFPLVVFLVLLLALSFSRLSLAFLSSALQSLKLCLLLVSHF